MLNDFDKASVAEAFSNNRIGYPIKRKGYTKMTGNTHNARAMEEIIQARKL